MSEPVVDEPRIVEAAMASASALGNKGLGQRVEAAMSAAVQQCYDEGITDPEKIREAMQAARARVKAGQ